MNSPFSNSYWLEPDRILCGEYPRDFDDLEDHEGMTAVLQAGVRVFIDLTEEGELKPYHEIARTTARDLAIDPDDLIFHRYPIRDVSVPKDAEEMRAILRTIRLARHRHQTVYLHCWGGRGRTGTVAGCVLSELFQLSGEDALIALAERWLDCAKSEHSDSPETDEQRGFVRQWNPVESSFASKVRSAVLGAAVGDALGVPVEFQGRGIRDKDPVIGMREFGTHHQPAGTWSDDTSMILATMTGFLEAGTYSPDHVMKEFVAWMTEAKHTPHGTVFDIGNATREAIGRYIGGREASESGLKDEFSNGNGSLMRILPVALAFGDDPNLIEKSWEISALTHAHERSRMCCAFYCLVVSELLHDSPVSEAIKFAWEVMNARWSFSPDERVFFDQWHPDLLENLEVHGSGHVIDTLGASLWANASQGSYRETVLYAVNLGDDTDTTGCVAGGLAGLLYGVAGIPDEWLNVLAKKKDIIDLADRFAGFCLQQSRQPFR